MQTLSSQDESRFFTRTMVESRSQAFLSINGYLLECYELFFGLRTQLPNQNQQIHFEFERRHIESSVINGPPPFVSTHFSFSIQCSCATPPTKPLLLNYRPAP